MDHQRAETSTECLGEWRRPVLRPMSGAAGARAGSSTYIVESTAKSSLYAPLPS